MISSFKKGVRLVDPGAPPNVVFRDVEKSENAHVHMHRARLFCCTADRFGGLILPDLTQYDIFTTPRLATTVLPFLDGQSDAKSWKQQLASGKK